LNYVNGTKKQRGAALAAQFRAQAQKTVEQVYTAEVRLPIPEIAPGFVFEFIGQRVDINSMLVAGELPEAFARKILAGRVEDQEIDKEEAMQRAIHEASLMSVDEKNANLEFQRKIAIKACVSPRLVMQEPTDDEEVDLRALPFAGNLITALFSWAMNGLSPEVPVATVGGEATTVQAVENFSVTSPRAELPDVGDGCAQPI
jgi:hypothetical protein